jgi:hypothetical protein
MSVQRNVDVRDSVNAIRWVCIGKAKNSAARSDLNLESHTVLGFGATIVVAMVTAVAVTVVVGAKEEEATGLVHSPTFPATWLGKEVLGSKDGHLHS